MDYHLVKYITSLPFVTFTNYWHTDNNRVLEIAKMVIPPLVHVCILKQMSMIYGMRFYSYIRCTT